MSLIGKKISSVFKNLLNINNTSGTGLASGLANVIDGAGNSSPVQLGTTKALIKPSTDTTTAFQVHDSGGNAVLTADTTNNYVKVGVGQNHASVKEKVFSSLAQGGSAGYHYCLAEHVFGGVVNIGPSLGNGSNPSASYDMSGDATYGQYAPFCFWHVPYNITMDSIEVLVSGNTATTGTDVHYHVCSADVSTSAGTKGDLSNITVLANSAADVEDIVKGEFIVHPLSLVSARVTSGKIILATVEQVSINTTVAHSKLTIKYHLT